MLIGKSCINVPFSVANCESLPEGTMFRRPKTSFARMTRRVNRRAGGSHTFGNEIAKDNIYRINIGYN